MDVAPFVTPPVVNRVSSSGAIQAATSPTLQERGETRRRRNRDGTMSTAKISPQHLAAEPRRLRSKRQALELQKLLRARTGSLYDFIPNSTSSASVGSGVVILSYQLCVREVHTT